MKIIDFTSSAHRATIGLPLALAVALLSGCGGDQAGASSAQAPVAPAQVRIAPASATSAPASGKAGTPKSDVVGRRFDLGTIVRV
jgi:hypothetical protein